MTGLTRRHVTTIVYLLCGYAEQQRRMHGPLAERPGSIELTPTEMEAWAEEIEAEFHAQALPDNSPPEEDWLT